MKKLISLTLTLAMLLALAAPAFAAEDLILVGGEDYVEAYDESADWGEPNYDWIQPLEAEEDWSWEEYEAERAAERNAAIAERKAALGGVPDELGVMVDGVYLTFGADKPVAEDNVLLAPGAVLLPALGLDPQAEEYVPVRATAEAAGYTVLWDAQFETAVLVDRQSLIDGIDSKLSILNGLYTRNVSLLDETGAIRGAIDLDVTVTMFNSLDGDEKFSIAADVDFDSSATAADMHVAMDLAELRAMIEPLLSLLTMGTGMDSDETAMLDSVLSLLGEVSFRVRFDMETGKMYFQIPLLAAFLPGLGADDWILVDMSDLMGEMPDWALDGTPTLGLLVYELAALSYGEYYYAYGYSVNENTPVFLHAGVAEAGASVIALAGDDRFVAGENGTRTLKLDASDISDMVGTTDEDDYGLDFTFLLKEFTFLLEVHSDNTFDFDFAIRPQVGYSSLSLADFRVAVNLHGGVDETVMELEVHYKNLVKVNVLLAEYWDVIDTPVSTTPPEDAKVWDIEDLVMGSPGGDLPYPATFE